MSSVIRHDARLLARDRVAAGSVLAFLVCLAVALFLGHDWAQSHRRALADHLSEDRFDATRVTRTIDVALPIVMPAPPLLDLAVGRTDLEPSHTATSFWAREDALFEDYQLDGPLALAAGRFDLAFVTVWLAPVLLIALGLSMVSAERDTGLLRMQAAASTSLGRRTLARAGLRFLIVFAPIAAAATVGARLAPPAPAKATHLALWVAAAGGYLLLWQAAVLLASTFRLRQEALGAALLALWALVIAVLPAFASATAQAVNPPPSRFALIAEARTAYQAAYARFTEELKGFLANHPDLTIGDDVAGYVVTNAALTGDIETAVRPSLARFDQARSAQRDVARWFELLSPALLTHRLLADAAGSGELAHADFRADSVDYHRTVRDPLLTAALRGADLRPSDHSSLPRFEPPASVPVRGVTTAAALLVAAAGVIAWSGARRLSRHDVAL